MKITKYEIFVVVCMLMIIGASLLGGYQHKQELRQEYEIWAKMTGNAYNLTFAEWELIPEDRRWDRE